VLIVSLVLLGAACTFAQSTGSASSSGSGGGSSSSTGGGYDPSEADSNFNYWCDCDCWSGRRISVDVSDCSGTRPCSICSSWQNCNSINYNWQCMRSRKTPVGVIVGIFVGFAVAATIFTAVIYNRRKALGLDVSGGKMVCHWCGCFCFPIIWLIGYCLCCEPREREVAQYNGQYHQVPYAAVGVPVGQPGAVYAVPGQPAYAQPPYGQPAYPQQAYYPPQQQQAYQGQPYTTAGPAPPGMYYGQQPPQQPQPVLASPVTQ